MQDINLTFLLTSAVQARPKASAEEILKLVPAAKSLPPKILSDKIDAIRRRLK